MGVYLNPPEKARDGRKIPTGSFSDMSCHLVPGEVLVGLYDRLIFKLAPRSTCLHRQVGAVLVRDKHILATGYNGAPSGEPHCGEVGCSKPEHGVGMERCRAVHAEANAIIQAARHGVSIEGATLYCTHSPCTICSAMLKNAGIKNTIYEEEYK